ncbi:hypothetical protein JX265_008243 [Neoarthrinium moseri]|uniref:RRM domain-containing protein n=1 Tax=Neoarthrinium moseri TaxID=1658444 RepID=A0A9P9WIQ3_9PEZI|nr:uncharacterized protein JN550_004942 [Neoarthrinium moseri]KAI1865196.1 hypothetical protein JX265_008243 [Neoarthrinium moseri]KAI1870796.1 hypothetical protein JN550_004942 [Neoarthrinium moseri]
MAFSGFSKRTSQPNWRTRGRANGPSLKGRVPPPALSPVSDNPEGGAPLYSPVSKNVDAPALSDTKAAGRNDDKLPDPGTAQSAGDVLLTANTVAEDAGHKARIRGDAYDGLEQKQNTTASITGDFKTIAAAQHRAALPRASTTGQLDPSTTPFSPQSVEQSTPKHFTASNMMPKPDNDIASGQVNIMDLVNARYPKTTPTPTQNEVSSSMKGVGIPRSQTMYSALGASGVNGSNQTGNVSRQARTASTVAPGSRSTDDVEEAHHKAKIALEQTQINSRAAQHANEQNSAGNRYTVTGVLNHHRNDVATQEITPDMSPEEVLKAYYAMISSLDSTGAGRQVGQMDYATGPTNHKVGPGNYAAQPTNYMTGSAAYTTTTGAPTPNPGRPVYSKSRTAYSTSHCTGVNPSQLQGQTPIVFPTPHNVPMQTGLAYGNPGHHQGTAQGRNSNASGPGGNAVVRLNPEYLRTEEAPALSLTSIAQPPAMFQPPTGLIRARRSDALNQLVGDGLPDASHMMHPNVFPFVEMATSDGPLPQNGVLHIKNIPFSVPRAHIFALFGSNAKLIRDVEEPVHIIMCKVTSKTHDAFVEFRSYDDAANAYERFKRHSDAGRVTRLGDRPVEVEVSSQTELMKQLFPIATGVVWHGTHPMIQSDSPYSFENFKAFVTEEEMAMLVKHVEFPMRSPFSRDCPERAFESMISTLKKLPWYMTQYITIKQRHYIYEACVKLINLLLEALALGDKSSRAGRERLTVQLLRRFTNAVMLCPGFTVCQKDGIADLVGMLPDDMNKFNMPRFSQSWVHQLTLGPKPGVRIDFLEYYIAIIREETNRTVAELPIHQKARLAALAGETDGYWGYFWYELNYPEGHDFDDLTLAQAAEIEWTTMDRILRRALRKGANDSSDDGTDEDGYEDQPRQLAGCIPAGLLAN